MKTNQISCLVDAPFRNRGIEAGYSKSRVAGRGTESLHADKPWRWSERGDGEGFDEVF